MTIINKYKCDICENEYDTIGECNACENKGVLSPQYKVGDTVYLVHHYPRDPKKPFGKREITKILMDNTHVPLYVFDKYFQIGKDTFVGHEREWVDVDESFREATENDFFRIGDKPFDLGIVISEETIDNADLTKRIGMY